MPSLRARLTNMMLRYTTKSLWRPGLDVATARRHAARMDAWIGRRAFATPVEETAIAGIRASWIGAPELATKGTLLYVHGGAWCMHLPATYRRFGATLSAVTGMRVLLVDYRLAPECPHPAAADDCFAVYQNLFARPDSSSRPLVIAGDSAGGNLALVTLMRARDAGLSLPCCAVLLSPATDLTFSGPSVRYNAAADPMFGSDTGDLVPDIYCPGRSCAQPSISPLFGDWAGLPPLYFLAGSTEVLLDDSVRAHDRALQAGTDASIDVWPDLPHAFPVFDWLPEARVAMSAIAAFVDAHVPHGNRRASRSLQAETPLDDIPASTAVDSATAHHSTL